MDNGIMGQQDNRTTWWKDKVTGGGRRPCFCFVLLYWGQIHHIEHFSCYVWCICVKSHYMGGFGPPVDNRITGWKDGWENNNRTTGRQNNCENGPVHWTETEAMGEGQPHAKAKTCALVPRLPTSIGADAQVKCHWLGLSKLRPSSTETQKTLLAGKQDDGTTRVSSPRAVQDDFPVVDLKPQLGLDWSRALVCL